MNIPRWVRDEHYRYKMPQLIAKIESRGNGIKTRLENIEAIAHALDRPVDYLIKFLGFDLGAGVKDGNILAGKHEAADLANHLDKFIEKYVLCGRCQNPETRIHVKRSLIFLDCKSCGYHTPCDISHRLSNFILRSPPPEEKKEELVETGPSPREEEEDDDWAVPTDPESVARRQAALRGSKLTEISTDDSLFNQLSPTTNPLPVLEKFWATLPSHEELIKLKERMGVLLWTEEAMINNLFGSMWLTGTPPALTLDGSIPKARFLSEIIGSEESTQKHVLKCMERMAKEHKVFADRFPDVLLLYWEQRVLDEPIIEKWYAHPNPKMPGRLSGYVRDRSDKFMHWLRTSPEEN